MGDDSNCAAVEFANAPFVPLSDLRCLADPTYCYTVGSAVSA